jgi:hypothetical protein
MAAGVAGAENDVRATKRRAISSVKKDEIASLEVIPRKPGK